MAASLEPRNGARNTYLQRVLWHHKKLPPRSLEAAVSHQFTRLLLVTLARRLIRRLRRRLGNRLFLTLTRIVSSLTHLSALVLIVELVGLAGAGLLLVSHLVPR
jgi:hypothetical protein